MRGIPEIKFLLFLDCADSSPPIPVKYFVFNGAGKAWLSRHLPADFYLVAHNTFCSTTWTPPAGYPCFTGESTRRGSTSLTHGKDGASLDKSILNQYITQQPP